MVYLSITAVVEGKAGVTTGWERWAWTLPVWLITAWVGLGGGAGAMVDTAWEEITEKGVETRVSGR